MPCDVFEKDPLWATLDDDAGDVGPEVTGVVSATTFASRAEGLAGVSSKDDVEGTAEGSGIETTQIVPDRGWSEVPRALGGDEDGAGPVFPLDKGAGVIAGLRKHEAQIKASAACAEGQSVPGT